MNILRGQKQQHNFSLIFLSLSAISLYFSPGCPQLYMCSWQVLLKKKFFTNNDQILKACRESELFEFLHKFGADLPENSLKEAVNLLNFRLIRYIISSTEYKHCCELQLLNICFINYKLELLEFITCLESENYCKKCYNDLLIKSVQNGKKAVVKMLLNFIEFDKMFINTLESNNVKIQKLLDNFKK